MTNYHAHNVLICEEENEENISWNKACVTVKYELAGIELITMDCQNLSVNLKNRRICDPNSSILQNIIFG